MREKEIGGECKTTTNVLLAMTKVQPTSQNSVPKSLGGDQLEMHPHDDIEEYHHLYHEMELYDNVHGKSLDEDRAIRARNL